MMLLFHLSQVGVLQDLSLDEIGQIEGVNRSTPLIPNQSTTQEAAAHPGHDIQGAVFPKEMGRVPNRTTLLLDFEVTASLDGHHSLLITAL
jgi:hypothetical protein